VALSQVGKGLSWPSKGAEHVRFGGISRPARSCKAAADILSERGPVLCRRLQRDRATQYARTRARPVEHARGAVRVNAVAPGPVFSDGADHDMIGQLGTRTVLERIAA